MGGKTLDLLRLLGTPAEEMPDTLPAFETALEEARRRMVERPGPVAFVVRKGTFAEEPGLHRRDERPLTRREAIATVACAVGEHDALIATTGHISRELFALADRPGNFYMQGSMGHAAAIGLGLALAQPARRVVVLDGDGAALMHLGTLSTVGHYAPANLLHIVLDNEAYESTGNQDSTSRTTALEEVAAACGYRRSVRCAGETDLGIALRAALAGPGPTMVLVKVSRHPAPALPRISTKYRPEEITAAFLRESDPRAVAGGAGAAERPRSGRQDGDRTDGDLVGGFKD
jgi:phosphonopyruvate decarboxylase